MEDFNGKVLEVGDRVAYIDGYSGSSVYLTEGYVKGFTAKQVKVTRDKENRGYASNVKPSRITYMDRL